MRDAETNLDNFDARYYSSALGRFMIPDWDAKATAVPYAAYGNPQTLNLYGYVGNNPITDTDATGHAGEGPTIAVSQAEPLDVTNQDNAHWEPQLDIDPELKGGSIIPMFVEEDVSSTDPTTVVLFAAGSSLAAVGNTQAQQQNQNQNTTQPSQGAAGAVAVGQLISAAGRSLVALVGDAAAEAVAAVAAPALIITIAVVAIPSSTASARDDTIHGQPWMASKGGGRQLPTWAEGERPMPRESGKDFAKRLCDARFGRGNYPTGPGSDFNKIKKWADRR